MFFRARETSLKQSWTKSRPFLQLSARPLSSSFWLPERCVIVFKIIFLLLLWLLQLKEKSVLSIHKWVKGYVSDLFSRCVSQVVEYILDRNACLLPAYLAVTEIRKLYPEGQLSHWVSVSRFVFLCVCSRSLFIYESGIHFPFFSVHLHVLFFFFFYSSLAVWYQTLLTVSDPQQELTPFVVSGSCKIGLKKKKP